MPSSTRTEMSPPAMGMNSVVLGIIALLLFFMPVLGIPLSLCGVGIGIVGIVASFTAPRGERRWCLMGLAASLLALAINVALALAPAGYLRDQNVPRPWQPGSDRPFAPPPTNQKW